MRLALQFGTSVGQETTFIIHGRHCCHPDPPLSPRPAHSPHWPSPPIPLILCILFHSWALQLDTWGLPGDAFVSGRLFLTSSELFCFHFPSLQGFVHPITEVK